MRDHRSIGVAAASLHASYEFYFGQRKDNAMDVKNTPFLDWWKEVNDLLEDAGNEPILFGIARSWFAEKITPAEAFLRQQENIESSQEVRSYYDY
jgi:hypothetical protein